jgi:hypothetical protein
MNWSDRLPLIAWTELTDDSEKKNVNIGSKNNSANFRFTNFQTQWIKKKSAYLPVTSVCKDVIN